MATKNKIQVQVIKGSANLEALLRKIAKRQNRKLKDIQIIPNPTMLNLYTVIWEKK